MASHGESRTPHGVRGLKYVLVDSEGLSHWSHPSRGAWIEIKKLPTAEWMIGVAPLTGCVD